MDPWISTNGFSILKFFNLDDLSKGLDLLYFSNISDENFQDVIDSLESDYYTDLFKDFPELKDGYMSSNLSIASSCILSRIVNMNIEELLSCLKNHLNFAINIKVLRGLVVLGESPETPIIKKVDDLLGELERSNIKSAVKE